MSFVEHYRLRPAVRGGNLSQSHGSSNCRCAPFAALGLRRNRDATDVVAGPVISAGRLRLFN